MSSDRRKLRNSNINKNLLHPEDREYNCAFHNFVRDNARCLGLHCSFFAVVNFFNIKLYEGQIGDFI